VQKNCIQYHFHHCGSKASKIILMMPKTQVKNQDSSKFQESKSHSIKNQDSSKFQESKSHSIKNQDSSEDSREDSRNART